MSKKKTTEEFIKEAKEKHGNKYDYSKVEYINNHTKVCIICPEHGEFWQFPQDHLKGRGCICCAGVKKLTTSDFIEQAKKIHGDKYDYSKVIYKGYEIPVCIICPEHGEFWQTPHTHLSNHACPKCRYTKAWDTRGRITTEDFINEAKKVHGNKYDYSQVVYKNNRVKVKIICPEHGEFWQTPPQHLRGNGCPICSESHIEKEIRMFLENFKINFIYEKHFKELGHRSYDFYLPDLNYAIECQGIQHFEPVPFFGGIPKFKKQIESDKIKEEYCKNNGIGLIRVTTREFLKYSKSLMTVKQCLTLISLLKKSMIDEE